MAKVEFRYSLMTPSDFAKFRLMEPYEADLPATTLNPGTSWVVYVAGVDPDGTAVASATAALDHGGKPDAKQAYALARGCVNALIEQVRRLGHHTDTTPRLLGAPLPDAYRAQSQEQARAEATVSLRGEGR